MTERGAAVMDQGDETAGAGVIERGDLGYVGAADKGATAGAGQDREPQIRVGRHPGHLVDDLLHQPRIEAVELGGVVDRQPGDLAALGSFLVFDAKMTGRHL